MNEYFTLAQIDETAAAVRSRTDTMPKIGLILGSGLGSLADAIENPIKIPYNELPHWPVSTVVGHVGQLVLGQLQGQLVVVMQGRAHYYEGYSMAQVTLPVRVMQRLGVKFLIVTNAAGGVNPDFEPGDLMLLTDHLNLIGMAGLSPLGGTGPARRDEAGFSPAAHLLVYNRCSLARELGWVARQVVRRKSCNGLRGSEAPNS